MQSPALAAAGTHVVSVDEKIGIQALENIAPTKPPNPGQVEKREFEYTRHRTVCLTANLEVATGRLISPTLGPTRNEKDFTHGAAHREPATTRLCLSSPPRGPSR